MVRPHCWYPRYGFDPITWKKITWVEQDLPNHTMGRDLLINKLTQGSTQIVLWILKLLQMYYTNVNAHPFIYFTTTVVSCHDAHAKAVDSGGWHSDLCRFGQLIWEGDKANFNHKISNCRKHEQLYFVWFSVAGVCWRQ